MKSEELNPKIKIRAPLRCDGIGRLDCAEDTESGARLAVRWLPLEANGELAARACARLPEHPTLPRIRQTGTMDGKAYVAMDFPDGKLLAAVLGEPMRAEQVLEMGAQLADALATVHSQSVFHGEMSAESVLLAKGKAYLWDMPLVIANRLTDRRGEERLMHMLVRTAPYLPPERARGGAPSGEGDVYALAAVMCLAAGAQLPPSGTTLSLVHAIANLEWAPEVPALFHEPYRALIRRMLDKNAARRPTAREVADLLGQPAVAVPTIPEMPAVALPRDPAVARPPPAGARPSGKHTPFASAPGSLEPALLPRAAADAAAKVPSRPLEPTVPTRFEPTVKVTVPPAVLEALSDTHSDQEVKDALAHAVAPTPVGRSLELGQPRAQTPDEHLAPPPIPHVKPSPAAAAKAPVLAATALDGGAPHAARTPVPAATTAQLSAALAAKTPVPAATTAQLSAALAAKTPVPAATLADVGAALAVTPAPEAPVDAPVPAFIDPPVETPVAGAPAVALTDNLSVAEELAAAGASTLSPEEAAALEVLPRSRPTWLIAAALLALLTTVVVAGARMLTGSEPPAAAAPAVAAPALAPPAPSVGAPVPATPTALEADVALEDDEELVPLPSAPRARPAAPRIRKAGPRPVVNNEPTPTPEDFSFLETGFEAPKEELKRPEF